MIEDIRYAVYSVGSDGKDVLAVAVDSHDDAKRELEKLKSSNNGIACIRIKKCKVENFGKEGERIIGSEEIECWNKPADNGEKLSGHHMAGNSTSVAQITPAVAPALMGNNSTPAMSVGGTVSEKDKELISFLNDYADNGDLMGLSYGFFKEKAINGNGSTTSMPTATDVNNTGGIPTLAKTFEVEGNEVRIKKDRLHKLKEELEGLTKEINEIEQAQMAQAVNSNSNGNGSAAPAVSPTATTITVDNNNEPKVGSKSDDDDRNDDDDDDD